ncbi:hypothetical protein MRB53_019083 [Persea americana]|uniref:Uncharacterized protein n=1 Tax=Persea americana TaxID=3435 RepID=A0ACC2MAN3_PERAE|nr:hypothetical protein MRB53_019083 [Persea americana]
MCNVGSPSSLARPYQICKPRSFEFLLFFDQTRFLWFVFSITTQDRGMSSSLFTVAEPVLYFWSQQTHPLQVSFSDPGDWLPEPKPTKDLLLCLRSTILYTREPKSFNLAFLFRINKTLQPDPLVLRSLLLLRS